MLLTLHLVLLGWLDLGHEIVQTHAVQGNLVVRVSAISPCICDRHFFRTKMCKTSSHDQGSYLCTTNFPKKMVSVHFPTHMGPKYWGTLCKNSPHFHILHPWILDFTTNDLKPCASSIFSCISIQGPSSWTEFLNRQWDVTPGDK